MGSIIDRKIRFATAVHAINCTPKSLRNWLVRGQLGLAGHTVERQWLSLSLIDIAMLAVTRKLVDFGLKVEEASRQAREAVLNPVFQVPNEQGEINKNINEDELNCIFANLKLYSYPDENYAFGWRTQITRADVISLPANAVLVIAVDDVIATALRRTREHLSAARPAGAE